MNKYEALGFLSHRVMRSTETMSSPAHSKLETPKLRLVLKAKLEEMEGRPKEEIDIAEAVGCSCYGLVILQHLDGICCDVTNC